MRWKERNEMNDTDDKEVEVVEVRESTVYWNFPTCAMGTLSDRRRWYGCDQIFHRSVC